MFALFCSLLASLQSCFRTRAVLHAELLALRHQLLVLQRSSRVFPMRTTRGGLALALICSSLTVARAQTATSRIVHLLVSLFRRDEVEVAEPRCFQPAPYCTTEKLSCNVAVELLPTQTSKSEGSTTQPFLAALQ